MPLARSTPSVMAPAQTRGIDAVPVAELSRRDRGTLDLPGTLRELEGRRVPVIAMDSLAFDLGPSYGRMMAAVLAGIAELARGPALGRAEAPRRAG
jgi:DNA invertase Pin-like site-specific DNA recombinase